MMTAEEILRLPPHPDITMKKLREAVDKHRQGQEYDLCGFKLELTPWLKGTQTLILQGDKAYYYHNIFDTGSVEIMIMPVGPSEPLLIDV